MTFKPLDLQMSIPRTPDASAYHAGQMAKQTVEQQALAQAAEKQTERNRQRSTNVEETEKGNIRDGEEKQQDGRQQNGSKRDTEEETKRSAPAHPYKGKHIDISF